MTVYAAQKLLSEQAVWEWVDKHPHVELTTGQFNITHGLHQLADLSPPLVNPPFFYGPFAPGHKSPYEGEKFNPLSLSTVGFFYQFIQPKADVPPMYFVDIRDAARALVAALKAPPASQVGRKRILIASECIQPADVADLITKERPALAGRVSEAVKAANPGLKPVVDNKRLKEVLGVEPLPWQKTVLDTVDTLTNLEAEWKARGAPI